MDARELSETFVDTNHLKSLAFLRRKNLSRTSKEVCVVPLAGIEPALLAELDFESSASTNSATGAFPGSGSARIIVAATARQPKFPQIHSIRRGAWDKPPASARDHVRRGGRRRRGPVRSARPGHSSNQFSMSAGERWPACASAGPLLRKEWRSRAGYARNRRVRPRAPCPPPSPSVGRPAHRNIRPRKVDVRRRPAAGRKRKDSRIRQPPFVLRPVIRKASRSPGPRRPCPRPRHDDRRGLARLQSVHHRIPESPSLRAGHGPARPRLSWRRPVAGAIRPH